MIVATDEDNSLPFLLLSLLPSFPVPLFPPLLTLPSLSLLSLSLLSSPLRCTSVAEVTATAQVSILVC